MLSQIGTGLHEKSTITYMTHCEFKQRWRGVKNRPQLARQHPGWASLADPDRYGAYPATKLSDLCT